VGSRHSGLTHTVEVVDRFLAAFNERDIPALTTLLLETVCIDVVGDGGERGQEANWIRFSFAGYDGRREDWHWAERRTLDAEAICVHLHRAGGVNVLEDVTRLNTDDRRVSHIRSYTYCPQTLEEAASRLGLPFVTHGYRAGLMRRYPRSPGDHQLTAKARLHRATLAAG
jgi:hypothetical protein